MLSCHHYVLTVSLLCQSAFVLHCNLLCLALQSALAYNFALHYNLLWLTLLQSAVQLVIHSFALHCICFGRLTLLRSAVHSFVLPYTCFVDLHYTCFGLQLFLTIHMLWFTSLLYITHALAYSLLYNTQDTVQLIGALSYTLHYIGLYFAIPVPLRYLTALL